MANTDKIKNSNLTESTTSTKRKSPKTTATKKTAVTTKKETKSITKQTPKTTAKKVAKTTASKTKATVTAKASTTKARKSTEVIASKTSSVKTTGKAKASTTTKAKVSVATKAKANTTTKAKVSVTTKAKASTTTRARASVVTKAKSSTVTKAKASTKDKATKSTKATTASRVVIPAPIIKSVDFENVLEQTLEVVDRIKEKPELSTTPNSPHQNSAQAKAEELDQGKVAKDQQPAPIKSNMIPLPKILSPATSLVLSKQPQINVDNSERKTANQALEVVHNQAETASKSNNGSGLVSDEALGQYVEQHRDDPIALEAKYQQQLDALIAQHKAHYQKLRKSNQYQILAYEYGYTDKECADFYAYELLKALSECDFEKINIHGVTNEFYAESLANIEEQKPFLKNSGINTVSLFSMWFYTYIDEMPIQTRIQFLSLISNPYFSEYGLDLTEYEKYVVEKIKKQKERQSQRNANRQQRNLSRRQAHQTVHNSNNSTSSEVNHNATVVNPNFEPKLGSDVVATTAHVSANSTKTINSNENTTVDAKTTTNLTTSAQQYKQQITDTRFYLLDLVKNFVHTLSKFYLDNLNADNFIDLNLWSFVESVRVLEYKQIKELKEKIESLLSTNSGDKALYQQQLAYLEHKNSFINENLDFCGDYIPQVNTQNLYQDKTHLSSYALSKLFYYYPMLESLPLFEMHQVDNISVFEFVVAFITCKVVYNNPIYRQLAQEKGIVLPQVGLEFLDKDEPTTALLNSETKDLPAIDKELKAHLDNCRKYFHELVTEESTHKTTRKDNASLSTTNNKEQTVTTAQNLSATTVNNFSEKPDVNEKLAVSTAAVLFSYDVSSKNIMARASEYPQSLFAQASEVLPNPTMISNLFGIGVPAVHSPEDFVKVNYLIKLTGSKYNDIAYQNFINAFLNSKSNIKLYTIEKNYNLEFSNFNQVKFDQYLAQITRTNEQLLGLDYCLVARSFTPEYPFFSQYQPSTVASSLHDRVIDRYQALVAKKSRLEAYINKIATNDNDHVNAKDQTVSTLAAQANTEVIDQNQVARDFSEFSGKDLTTLQNDLKILNSELSDLEAYEGLELESDKKLTPKVEHIKFENGTDLKVTAFTQDEHNLGLNSIIYQKYFGYRAFKYFPNGTFLELLGLPSAQVQSNTYLISNTQINPNYLADKAVLDKELNDFIDHGQYGSLVSELHFEDCINKYQKNQQTLFRNTYKAYEIARLSSLALQIFNLSIDLVIRTTGIDFNNNNNNDSESSTNFTSDQINVDDIFDEITQPNEYQDQNGIRVQIHDPDDFNEEEIAGLSELFEELVTGDLPEQDRTTEQGTSEDSVTNNQTILADGEQVTANPSSTKLILDPKSSLYNQAYAKLASLFLQYNINSDRKVEILKGLCHELVNNSKTALDTFGSVYLSQLVANDNFNIFLNEIIIPICDSLARNKDFIKQVNDQANMHKADNQIGQQFNYLVSNAGLTNLVKDKLNLYQTLPTCYSLEQKAQVQKSLAQEPTNQKQAQVKTPEVKPQQLIANQLVFEPGNFVNRDCSDLLFLFLVDLGFLGSLEDNIHIVTSMPCPNPYYRGLTALSLSSLIQRNYLRQKLSLSQLAFPIASSFEENPQTTYSVLKAQSLADFNLPAYVQKLAEYDCWYNDLGFSRLAPLAQTPIELDAKFEQVIFGTNHPSIEAVHNFIDLKYFYSEQTCVDILNQNFMTTNDYLEQVNNPNNHLSPEYLALAFIKGIYQNYRKVEAEKQYVKVTPKLIETLFRNKVRASLANFQSLTTTEDFNAIFESITKDYIDNFNRQGVDLEAYVNDPQTHEDIDLSQVPGLQLVIEALTKVALGGHEEIAINRTQYQHNLLTDLGQDEAIYTLYEGKLSFDLPQPNAWEDTANQTIDLFSFMADKASDLVSNKFANYTGLGEQASVSLDSINTKKYKLLAQAKENLTNIPALAASILALIELDPTIGGKVNYELGLDFMLQAAQTKHPFAIAYLAKFFSQVVDFYDSRVSIAPTLPQRLALLDQFYNDLYPQIAQALNCRNSASVNSPEVVQFLEGYYLVKRQYLAFIQSQIHQANTELTQLHARIIPVLEEKAHDQGSNHSHSDPLVDNDSSYSPELIAKAKEAFGVNKDKQGYSQVQAQRLRQHKEQMDLKAERLYRQFFAQLQLKVNLLSEYNAVEEGLVTLATHSHFYIEAEKTAQAKNHFAQTFTKESYTRLTRLGEEISELSGRDSQYPLSYKEAEDFLTHYAFYCTDASGRNFYFDKFAEINHTNEQYAQYSKEFAHIYLDDEVTKLVDLNPCDLAEDLALSLDLVNQDLKDQVNSNPLDANQLDPNQLGTNDGLSESEHIRVLNRKAIEVYTSILALPRSTSQHSASVFFSDVKVSATNSTSPNNSKAKPKKAKSNSAVEPYCNLKDLASKSLATIYLEQMANLKRQYVVCFEQAEDANASAYLQSTQTPLTVLSPFEISQVSLEDRYEDQAYILNALEPFPNYIGDYFRLIGDMFAQRPQKFTSQYAFLVTDQDTYYQSSSASSSNPDYLTTGFSDLEASYLLAPNLTISTLVTNLMNPTDATVFASYQSPRGRMVLGKKLNTYIAYFINKCKLLAPQNLHLNSDQSNAQARYFSDLVDYVTLPQDFRADNVTAYATKAQSLGSATTTEDLTVASYLSKQDLANCYSSIQGNPLIYAQEHLDFTQAEQTNAKIAVVNHLSQVLFNFYQICQYLDNVKPLTDEDVTTWVKGHYPLTEQELEQFNTSFNRLVDINYNTKTNDSQAFISFNLVDGIKSLLGSNHYPVRIFNLDVLLSDRYLTPEQINVYSNLVTVVKHQRQNVVNSTDNVNVPSIYNSELEQNYYFKEQTPTESFISQVEQFKATLSLSALPQQFTYALHWKIVDHLFRVATSDYCPRNYDARIYFGVYNLLASPYLNSLEKSIALLECNDVPNQTKFGFNQLVLGLLYTLKSCDLATSEVRFSSLHTDTETDCLEVFIPSDKSQNQAFLPASSYSIDHASFKAKALATLELANELSSHWMLKFILGLVYRNGLLGAKVDMRRGKDLILASLMILNETEVQFTLKSKVSMFIQPYLSEALPQELANANDFDLIKIIRSFDIAWFAEMISVDSLNLETLLYTWTE